jgi:hypothetical protein
MGTMLRRYVTLLLLCAWAVVLAGAATASDQQSNASIPSAELARLRPVVLPDLKAFLSNIYREPVSDADAVQEFSDCKFSRLILGPLGPAILVEASAGHGKTNAAMLNLYVPDHGSFRRVAAAQGFGPEVMDRNGAPPDLVFGWTEGVCTVTYHRYHYEKGQYNVNGCAQEDRDSEPKTGEFCAIKECDSPGKLAVFDPPSNQMPPDYLPKPDGASCVVSPGLEPAQAVADSAQPVPSNQVHFLFAARTTGDCQPAAIEGGTWTTSDPANTTVDARGKATCLHPTSTPAIITYTGTFKNHAFAPSSLSCK